MKLGVNLFSVRKFLRSEEDVRKTFHRIREIGYDVVQLSGAAPLPAETVREISRESGLPIVCTHVPLDRILHDTDEVIREHQTFDCPVIGLGFLPDAYRTAAALHALLEELREPVGKIRRAGLHFAYHNHAFEFDRLPDAEGCIYDILLRECPDWQFIMDTYWVTYGGETVIPMMERIGAGKLTNIHFKDMSRGADREICACGEGRLDFAACLPVCEALGCENILVEQDNANDRADPFGELEISYRALRPLVK